MICNHLTELPSQVLTNRLCRVFIHTPRSELLAEEEYLDKRKQRGRPDVSTPLLCICVYFGCHPNANLETLYEGVLLRESNQRKLAVFNLLNLLLLLFGCEYGSKFIKQPCHLRQLLLGIPALTGSPKSPAFGGEEEPPHEYGSGHT